MKKLKKYICVLAAAFMLASFASFPVYAEPEVIPEESEDSEEEDPDELIPIEEETTAPDDEDIEFIDPEVTTETTTAAVTAADTTEPPAETTEFVTPQYTAVDPYTMYATDVINVRYGPDTSYSKFGTLYAGASVQIIGTVGNWLVINHNGVTGFVSASFFTSTAPTTTSATTAAQTTAPQDTTAPEETEVSEPEETTPAVTEAPVETTQKTKAPEKTKPAETTEDEEEKAAAVTDNDNKDGGFGGLLIALGCAVGTFLLIGVIPVIIHSIYHKKLYQY